MPPKGRNSKSRANQTVVPPGDVAADSNDPYSNPKEHRLFTPRKVYNFGQLNPTGNSAHPESVKRRTIVAKKAGIEAARFTIRETARSRRRHRKDALRKTAKYQAMSMQEQLRAMTEIDENIKREIAASDREAELSWAILQGQGQSPSQDLTSEQARAQQLLLEDGATSDNDLAAPTDPSNSHKPKKKFKSSSKKSTHHQQHSPSSRNKASKKHRTPAEIASQLAAYMQQSRMAGSSEPAPQGKRMTGRRSNFGNLNSAVGLPFNITSADLDEFLDEFTDFPDPFTPTAGAAGNSTLAPSSIPALANELAQFEPKHPEVVTVVKKTIQSSGRARLELLKKSMEKSQDYKTLTSKNKKVKLDELETIVKADTEELLTSYEAARSASVIQGSMNDSGDSDDGSTADDATDSADEDSAASPVKAEGGIKGSTGGTKSVKGQSFGNKRTAQGDFPEKTRLHNRSKSSPKKRRFAPISFEAVEKPSRANTGEGTPSGSEPSGDANLLRRVTRSRTSDNHFQLLVTNNASGTVGISDSAAAATLKRKASDEEEEQITPPTTPRTRRRGPPTNGADDHDSDDSDTPTREELVSIRRSGRAHKAPKQFDEVYSGAISALKSVPQLPTGTSTRRGGKLATLEILKKPTAKVTRQVTTRRRGVRTRDEATSTAPSAPGDRRVLTMMPPSLTADRPGLFPERAHANTENARRTMELLESQAAHNAAPKNEEVSKPKGSMWSVFSTQLLKDFIPFGWGPRPED
ncbi:hypothetical protein ABW20_dc0106895 [Dactylellina cionopaga]|nr:hypothetical protein ABW20_dc0106895 [Dactylellina cionopaga]